MTKTPLPLTYAQQTDRKRLRIACRFIACIFALWLLVCATFSTYMVLLQSRSFANHPARDVVVSSTDPKVIAALATQPEYTGSQAAVFRKPPHALTQYLRAPFGRSPDGFVLFSGTLVAKNRFGSILRAGLLSA